MLIRAAIGLSIRKGSRSFPPPTALSAAIVRAKLESTVRYLGIEVDDAIELAEKVEM